MDDGFDRHKEILKLISNVSCNRYDPILELTYKNEIGTNRHMKLTYNNNKQLRKVQYWDVNPKYNPEDCYYTAHDVSLGDVHLGSPPVALEPPGNPPGGLIGNPVVPGGNPIGWLGFNPGFVQLFFEHAILCCLVNILFDKQYFGKAGFIKVGFAFNMLFKFFLNLEHPILFAANLTNGFD